MRINIDCVRRILLCVEENAGLRTSCYFIDTYTSEKICEFFGDSPIIPDYQYALQETFDNSTLIYHVRYCIEAGLLKADEVSTRAVLNHAMSDRLGIYDLSVSGHDLLNKIRDDTRWRGIKKALPAIRNYSLDAINAISQGMTSSAISAFLERNP